MAMPGALITSAAVIAMHDAIGEFHTGDARRPPEAANGMDQ